MNYKTVYTILNNDLKKIEKELEYVLDAHSQLLKESSLHYLQAGERESVPFLYCYQPNLETIIFKLLKMLLSVLN